MQISLCMRSVWSAVLLTICWSSESLAIQRDDWSDCANARGDLSPRCSHMSFWFCCVPAHIVFLYSVLLLLNYTAAIVDCRKFIESDCLGLVFTALSSHDLAMRRAACHVIERYRDHLEGARFMEMDQIKYILGLLRDSMSGLKVKLACIVTVFLARAVKVMLKPGKTFNSFHVDLRHFLSLQMIIFSESGLKHGSAIKEEGTQTPAKKLL